MKYCANCDRHFEPHIQRCTICNLLLLDLPDTAMPTAQVLPEEFSQETNVPRQEYVSQPDKYSSEAPQSEAPLPRVVTGQETLHSSESDPMRPVEVPVHPKPAEETLLKSILSVIGSTTGVLLLILVAGVLVFSIFRDDLFGSESKITAAPSPSAGADQPSPSPTATEPTEEPLSVSALSISSSDMSSYERLCEGSVWLDETTPSALSFYPDHTYLCSDLDGNTILSGESAVSEGLLYMSTPQSELTAYKFYFDENRLYIQDSDTGSETVYLSEDGSGDPGRSLFEYPITTADYTSYSELVESGPWTDVNTGYILTFNTDNTYLAESANQGSVQFGSALVSDGLLCMVQGSDYETVYECTYTLSSGTLTISYAGNSWSLLSKAAYEALLQGVQADEELYGQLVAGSYWCTRGDQYLYNLYFVSDHTFAMYIVDLGTGDETLVHEGEALLSQGILKLVFNGKYVEYAISVEDNLLIMTDMQTGGETTYETYSTFYF